MIDERKTAIQQISLSHTLREERLILATEADKSTRWKDIQEMQNILLQFGGGWQSEIRSRGTPDPILVPSVHLQELRQLQGALTAAVTNIIDRWWIDTESQFPQRMPVERHEEEVLRVRNFQGTLENIITKIVFSGCMAREKISSLHLPHVREAGGPTFF